MGNFYNDSTSLRIIKNISKNHFEPDNTTVRVDVLIT